MHNSSVRLSDQIAEQIKQYIHEHNLQPGDRLPSERQLCDQLQVSRSPVREALRMLTSQGLLVTRRGGGSYVQSDLLDWPVQSMAPLGDLISEDPLYRYDVLEARMALESSTAWHAAMRATQADKDQIRRCFDVMVQHQQNNDAQLSARADAQFHLAIAKASHNVVLLQIMHSLFQLVLSTVKENRRVIFKFNDAHAVELLTRQHEALMQAILDSDAPRARQLVTEHLEYVHDNVRTSEEDAARKQRISRLNTKLPLL